MVRLSLKCAHCGQQEFEAHYWSGGCDGSWQIELECQHCHRVTLVAVTQGYVGSVDCVNEPRECYRPTVKMKGEEDDGKSRTDDGYPQRDSAGSPRQQELLYR